MVNFQLDNRFKNIETENCIMIIFLHKSKEVNISDVYCLEAMICVRTPS